MPDVPEPTSFSLTKDFYITTKKIVETVLVMFNRKSNNLNKDIKESYLHDVPGPWFKGPF